MDDGILPSKQESSYEIGFLFVRDQWDAQSAPVACSLLGIGWEPGMEVPSPLPLRLFTCQAGRERQSLGRAEPGLIRVSAESMEGLEERRPSPRRSLMKNGFLLVHTSLPDGGQRLCLLFLCVSVPPVRDEHLPMSQNIAEPSLPPQGLTCSVCIVFTDQE